MASSPWPCPRLTDRILDPAMSSFSAIFWISSAGFAPGLMTQTMGLYWVLCLYTSRYLRIGGEVYFSPISGVCAMNWLAAKKTRSTRKHRRRHIFWNAVSLSEYPQGYGDDSGRSRSNQSAHSFSLFFKSSRIVENTGSVLGSLSRSWKPCSGIQGKYLVSVFLPRDTFPFRKKSKPFRLILPSPSKTLTVIWKANMSLCFSKMPMHTYLYTARVRYSMILFRRFSISKWGSDFSSDTLNTSWLKAIRLYSYMLSMADKLSITKKRIAPRLATGVYS
mmetsp:Transcript_10670/g.18950  ORF Transcript_10670/g.18950 Transcript_10670/m.18950 type:complete len:277 (-) Transcript_10670:11449-12279(-)